MIKHICGNGVSFDSDGGRHNHIAQNGAAVDPVQNGILWPLLKYEQSAESGHLELHGARNLELQNFEFKPF
jgi:hypothetical protein